MLKPAFQDACRAACEALARETGDGGPAVLVGLPWAEDGKLYNAYALLDGGADRGACASRSTCRTTACSTRSACSTPGPLPGPIVLPRRAHRRADLRGHLGRRGRRVPRRDRRRDPARANGSPYWRGKTDDAHEHRGRARRPRAGCRSSISTRSAARTSWSSTAPPSCSTPTARSPASCRRSARRSRSRVWETRRRRAGAACEAPMRACSRRATRPTTRPACSGLRDYVDKNGFPGVVLGLSGGIDSALCAAMAVDALGPERVHCVMLPYRYTSQRVASTTPPTAPRRSACATTSCRSPRRSRASRRRSTPLFAGTPARHHRGEHPEPRARHAS